MSADPPPPPPSQHGRASGTWLGRAAGRLLGGPGRVPGVDVARGLAVLGMFTAHVGVTSNDWSQLSGWLSLAHGRSSILFATVAGLSLALISGRAEPFAVLTGVRARVLGRAACLFVIGALLDALGTRVYVILGFYAVYFLLTVPVLRWRVRGVVAAAAVVAVVGPPLVYWAPGVLVRLGMPSAGDDVVARFLLTGHYPAAVWIAYVFVGLAIGRSAALTSPRLRVALIIGGGGAWALAATWSALLLDGVGGADAVRATVRATTMAWDLGIDTPLPAVGLFLPGPHDDTLVEMVGSGGFAVMVIGLCLFVGRRGARVLAPLAAVGSMALTVYTLQIVAIWGWDLLGATTNRTLAVMVVATLAGATAWRAVFGRGLLERMVGRVANAVAANTLVDDARR